MIKKRSAGDANGTLRPQAAAAGGASTTPLREPPTTTNTDNDVFLVRDARPGRRRVQLRYRLRYQHYRRSLKF